MSFCFGKKISSFKLSFMAKRIRPPGPLKGESNFFKVPFRGFRGCICILFAVNDQTPPSAFDLMVWRIFRMSNTKLVSDFFLQQLLNMLPTELRPAVTLDGQWTLTVTVKPPTGSDVGRPVVRVKVEVIPEKKEVE